MKGSPRNVFSSGHSMFFELMSSKESLVSDVVEEWRETIRNQDF